MVSPRQDDAPLDDPDEEQEPGEDAWRRWATLAAEAVGDLLDSVDGHDGPLLAEVEQYLLLALLTPHQRVSVRRRGWFELPWPEMALTLRVHTRTLPTVDAYQPRPDAGGARNRSAQSDGPSALPAPTLADLIAEARGARFGAVPASDATYIVSWDISRVRRAAGGAIRFRCGSATPVGLARLVLETYRRRALVGLLDAAEPVRLRP